MSAPSSNPGRCKCPGDGRSTEHKSSDSGESEENYTAATATKKRKTVCNAVAAKTSIKYLHDLVSRFGSDKRRLVSEIGFGGILEFPPLRQINRRFALWVMSRIDPMNQAIVIDGNRMIKFDKYDVHRVFGIPCDGHKVAMNDQPREEIVSKVMNWFGCTAFKEHRSIRAAQEIVEEEYNRPMTTDEENAFKLAFVIYVVSTVLSPGAKYDYPSVDYWDALIDPDGIQKFDWSDYVIRKLFDSVVKLQSDLKASRKVATVTGCCLFLQVIYLDSIDTGPLKLDHKQLPRIKDFRNDVMSSMILFDARSKSAADGEVEFGQRQLRPCVEVCYSWAIAARGDLMWLEPPDQRSLWDDAVSVSQLTIGSSEAAGPIYFGLLDAYSHSKILAKFECIRMHCAVNILSIYMRGFRYTIGSPDPGFSSAWFGCYRCTSSVDRVAIVNLVSVNKRCQACGALHRGIPRDSLYDSAKASFLLLGGHLTKFIKEAPLLMYLRCMGIRAMARYYFALRASKFRGDFDLNHEGYDHESEVEVILKVVTSCCEPVLTPWELGLNDVVDQLDVRLAEAVEKKIIGCAMDSMKCVMSNVPKHIEVSVSSVRMYMMGKAEMELDLFDAFVRVFKHIDDALYHGKAYQRWRHIFESDFLGNVLAGYFDINDRSLQCQLLGRHLDYDVPKCRMLLFPGLMEDRWVCYSWSLCDNIITVFDPISNQMDCDHHVKVHKRVACAIATAMDEVASKLFNGWRHDWKLARVVISRISFPYKECVNRTGQLCAMFCLTFNGMNGDTNPHIVSLEDCRWKMCALISRMQSHHGLFAELL